MNRAEKSRRETLRIRESIREKGCLDTREQREKLRVRYKEEASSHLRNVLNRCLGEIDDACMRGLDEIIVFSVGNYRGQSFDSTDPKSSYVNELAEKAMARLLELGYRVMIERLYCDCRTYVMLKIQW